ncbi:MAG: hypothetical protein M1828_004624 [Chrysothrix sp. TS-e1954]|nr:MAG: hypothetical protein M1828_004624 [Chrysothrix sp. TS-e1954]
MVAGVLQVWHDHRTEVILGLILVQALLQACIYLWRSYRKPLQNQAELLQLSEKAQVLSNVEKGDATAVERIQPIGTNVVSRRVSPKRITRQIPQKSSSYVRKQTRSEQSTQKPLQPLVFFYSLGGSTEKYAKDFVEAFNETLPLSEQDASAANELRAAKLLDLSTLEYDDYFTSLPKDSQSISYFYVLLIPSYDIDTNLNTLLEHLRETHHDFRIDTEPLSNLRGYAVLGFGDEEGWPTEEEGFCYQAKEVDKWMAKLTARKRAYPLGMADVKKPRDVVALGIKEWHIGVRGICEELAAGSSLGEGVPGSGRAVESEEEDEEVEAEDEAEPSRSISKLPSRGSKSRRKTVQSTVEDLESISPALYPQKKQQQQQTPIPIDFTTSNSSDPPQKSMAPPMVPTTSPTYAALTKQGYTILGTHSGVKICRWTKSALRGRGSCYKHSFYGIASHLCMETTPSLSCSNKCVFCWRHGTNPVGTTWRWQVDPPGEIFEGAKAAHLKKIKMLRGVPGVRADRFEDATRRVRHCALSLVGEPIFYPHINEFVGMLHKERISSFLVCNAQHPAQLRALTTVTQLYVSIDASDPVSLRKIDRPLHRDYWQRFTSCLDIVRSKRMTQRTVFRLTLVKGFNIDEQAQGYADLVARGLPGFIEVKGVTYCGTSTSAGAGLSMANVPFYEEVAAFCVALDAALAERGLDYGIAAEHAHSCCVLLADRRFFIDGKWCTVIDYERFFELLETRGDAGFAPEECVSPTEEWALWGNGGFDPRDERVRKRGKAARAAAIEEKANDAAAADAAVSAVTAADAASDAAAAES